MENRKLSCLMLAALAVALLSGCGAAMDQPLPAASLSAAERARFEGAWMDDNPDGVLHVHLTCDGVAHVASVEWKDGGYRIEQTELVLSQGPRGGEASRFISMRFTEGRARPGRKPLYLLLKYRFVSDDTLVIWDAHPEPFAEAIQSGRLKGGTGEREGVIASPPPAVLAFIDDPDDHRLFDYQRPLVFRKLVRPGPPAPPQECPP